MHACACVDVWAQQKSLFHNPLNSWMIDKDACSQIHMSGSRDRVEMQVLTQEIHLHSKTTRKNCARMQSINTDMQTQQKELVCVSLFYMRMHTHTDTRTHAKLLFIYLSRCSGLSQVHSLNAGHYC